LEGWKNLKGPMVELRTQTRYIWLSFPVWPNCTKKTRYKDPSGTNYDYYDYYDYYYYGPSGTATTTTATGTAAAATAITTADFPTKNHI